LIERTKMLDGGIKKIHEGGKKILERRYQATWGRG
jgi:hypothetical protein